ncbi:hypothetical protein H5410_026816 [Solanum commersonii]|uniref:Uncharacterized protein n=1 Tax=Solanum commersonii TaxID=4109 RepID=A0A9J5Z1Q5_SOLCO|nr:hypothetical protein H5410_026816 [Solanum commersonii]
MKAKWKKKIEYYVKLTEENEDPINIYSCRRWSIDWDGIEIFEDGSPHRSSELSSYTYCGKNKKIGFADDGRCGIGRIGFGSNLMDMLLVIIGSGVLMWQEIRARLSPNESGKRDSTRESGENSNSLL